jgi:regulator of sirC expression with transglutaminase-like and TPR domain
MSKLMLGGITVFVITVLAAFSAVQSYRVHDLNRRLKLAAAASVSQPPKASVEKAVENDRFPALMPAKPEGTGQNTPASAPATKEVESMLLKERARLQSDIEQEKAGRPESAASGPAVSETPAGDAAPGADTDAAGNAAVGKNAAKAAKRNAGRNPKQRAATTAEVRALLAQAQSAVENGTYSDAIAILKQGLQTNPASRDLYQTLAGLYRRLGQSDSELETYKAWSAQFPEEPSPHYDQARTLAAQGRGPESLQELDQYLNFAQEGINVFTMVASVYRALGMSAEEGNVIQTWVREAPNAIDAQRVLADYYARTGDTQSSLAEYQQIAQRKPEDADIRRNLANAYLRMNMNDQAAAELTTAIDLQPRNMSTRLQLGGVYRQNQQLEAAQQTFAGIVAAAPDSPEGQQAQRALREIQHQLQAQAAAPQR